MKRYFGLFAICCFCILLSKCNSLKKDSKIDENLKIYNANQLMELMETKGFNELNKLLINPTDLVYLDEKFAKRIIDLEFENGFLEKHEDAENTFIYKTPEHTFEIAGRFYNNYAANKLFEYYKTLPIQVKSDTIFYGLRILEDYFEIFIQYKIEGLESELINDFIEWNELANQNINEKKGNGYLKKKFKKDIKVKLKKFKKTKLNNKKEQINDSKLNAWQIARALNYIETDGFDNDFMDEFEKNLNYPFSNNEFSVYKKDTSKYWFVYESILANDFNIKNFRNDYKLIEAMLYSRIYNFSNSQEIHFVIENGRNAFIQWRSNTTNHSDIVTITKDNLEVKTVDWMIFTPMPEVTFDSKIDEPYEEDINVFNNSSNRNYTISQNKPNPFSDTTSISYQIKENYKTAKIIISDIYGIQLNTIDISNNNLGTVTFDGSDLETGVYNYTLIVDGVVKDSRRFIKK